MTLKLWQGLTLAIGLVASAAWAADSRITDLTELTSPNVVAGDFIECVDVSNTTDNAAGSSRKCQVGSLKSGIAGADVQAFTATGAGTWTKPTSFTPTTVMVVMWGAGGGGGAGASLATAVVAKGGAGGGGGSWIEKLYRASDLGATESVSVGAGGTAGAAGAAGAAGGDGASSVTGAKSRNGS